MYFLGSMTNSWLILLSVPTPRSNTISVKVGKEILDKLDHFCNVSNMMSVVFLNWNQKHKVLTLLDNFDYRHLVIWRKNTVQCSEVPCCDWPTDLRKKLNKPPPLDRAQSENCVLLPSCQHVTDWIDRYWRRPDSTCTVHWPGVGRNTYGSYIPTNTCFCFNCFMSPYDLWDNLQA